MDLLSLSALNCCLSSLYNMAVEGNRRYWVRLRKKNNNTVQAEVGNLENRSK